MEIETMKAYWRKSLAQSLKNATKENRRMYWAARKDGFTPLRAQRFVNFGR
jgi:hypothetical protein